MAAETVMAGKGTVLAYGTPYASPVYTTVAQVVSFDGPDSEMGTRTTTHLGSTAKTYAASIFEGGTLSGEGLFDPAGTNHAAMLALLAAGTLSKWKITFTNATPSTLVVDGVLTKFNGSGFNVDDSVGYKFEIKLSGSHTWA